MGTLKINRHPLNAPLQKTHPSQGGFTLVEMLIVVAITGILVGIALPTLNNSKAKAQEATRNAIQSAVETAKNRYILSKDRVEDYAGLETTFSHIQPFLLINGRAPQTFDEIGNKTKNKAGANITDLGQYWSEENPTIPMSWGDDPPSE